MHITTEVQAIPYSPVITVVLCDDINTARVEIGLKKSDKKNWDKNTIGFYFIDTGRHKERYKPYMFINVIKHDTILELLDTIIHETDHIAGKILQYSGVITDYDNDEAHTYLQGYIFQQVFAFFYENQDKLSAVTEILKFEKK